MKKYIFGFVAVSIFLFVSITLLYLIARQQVARQISKKYHISEFQASQALKYTSFSLWKEEINKYYFFVIGFEGEFSKVYTACKYKQCAYW